MVSISRRAALTALGVGGAAQLLPRTASATLVRGMPLKELVARSQHAVLGVAEAARCTHVEIGKQRRLVTETRLRIEGVLALTQPSESVLVVRTLGGELDGVGELVHGQAEFEPGKLCAAFFERAADGACWVTGMAQGHYPLERAGGSLVLHASPRLPTIRDWEQSAVKQLNGKRLSEAERLVAEAVSR